MPGINASIKGMLKRIVSHSSFHEDALPLAISKSQSISPVAFFCITIASASALATRVFAWAFFSSTLPDIHVPASSAIGPISKLSIRLPV